MTATLTRKRSERNLKYPLPFSKLPPDAKERAIEKYRESHVFPEWDDVDLLTETLEQDLEYEFGMHVVQRTEAYISCDNQKRTIQKPAIEWDTYPTRVSFQANISISAIVAHGVPGCEYSHPEAVRLRELWEQAAVLDLFVGGVDWLFGQYVDSNCPDRWIDIEGSKEEIGPAHWAQYVMIADSMDLAMQDYYNKACQRLRDILDGEIEYRNSDESIAETLAANDWNFDEEGECA